ncbi:tetratricopeptide repeat protein [Martelella alba]|uniref:Tetratricopeptide repeat protein n=1 Tax=Martelella alba TaxID=2590451 RepID=A0A506UF89_9HYPH|nr:tetratricopeptide repeat protein [Martelella alba]TPW32186.1 tetratricopeptide repeat protein [Martelella alba]
MMSPSQLAQISPRLVKNYQVSPGNLASGIAYAEYLKATGQYQQAETVMQDVVKRNPRSVAAQVYLSQAQAALGHYPDALRSARNAIRLDSGEWRGFNQEGLVLDQLGQPLDARMRYRQALELSPGNPVVLTDMATSYVLTHDLDTAEDYLRQAVSRPDAQPEVRSDLAIVVALKGDRSEAERIATTGVSADQARRNLAALAAAMAPGGAWQQYAADS